MGTIQVKEGPNLSAQFVCDECGVVLPVIVIEHDGMARLNWAGHDCQD